MKFLAKLVSVVFHPFVMPLVTLLLLARFDRYLYLRPEMFVYLLMVLGITTIAPLLSLGFMHKRKLISDLDISKRSERSKPFLIVLAYYALAYLLTLNISGIYIPQIYQSLFLGLLLSIFAGWAITLRYKISMHTLASGGVLGALLSAVVMMEALDLRWVSVVLVMGGLVGWSRLTLGAHTHKEIYYGYLVGFLSVWLTILIGLG